MWRRLLCGEHSDTRIDVCASLCTDIWIGHACCIVICMDMCIDICIDMRIYMRIGMCIGMFVDMFVKTRAQACAVLRPGTCMPTQKTCCRRCRYRADTEPSYPDVTTSDLLARPCLLVLLVHN